MPGRPALGLWARLVCFACLTALLLTGLSILFGVDGWRTHETGRELAVDIVARVSVAVWLGSAAGTAAAALAFLYLLLPGGSVEVRCTRVTRIAGAIMIVVCGSAIIGTLIQWSVAVGLAPLSNRSSITLWYSLTGLLVLASIVRCFIAPRQPLMSEARAASLSGVMTRRVLLIAGFGGLFTALSNNTDVSGVSGQSLRVRRPRSSGPNLLLVTFDALCAEDVSSYGYRLPTTPNIDALARSSYLFTNYYAASTFTTPCVVSTMTGRYPSSTGVYQFGGRLRGDTSQTLPHALRAAGYWTGASIANPGADPNCLGFGDGFDVLPPEAIDDFPTRTTAELFHSGQFAFDVARAGRFVPYMLDQLSPRTFGTTHSNAPPTLSFAQGREVLGRLKGPFFLWIHVFAPHFPYLPEPPYLRRFLPTNELRTHAEFADLFDLKGFTYTPARQPLVDKARLRYDEWLAEADGAFGEFIASLRSSGHLDNTAVIVSADHGESFQGGYMGHGTPQQLRPILHIPLVMHLPGQKERHDIATVADQSMLAPTLLELAGVARPDWMDGRSLLSSMRAPAGAESRLAFTQSVESNSAFRPLRHGTVGVIDGTHQYLLNLATGKGSLYALPEADEQKVDLAQAEPQVAQRLRRAIAQRFPNIPDIA